MNYKKLLHAGHNYLLRIGFVVAALLFFTNVSEATHFRYGSISWQHVSGNTYQITVSQAWRKSYFPNVVPGGIVQTGTMTLGDGSSVTVNLRVTTIDPVEDWFYGVYIFNKTYPATPAVRNYDVIFTGCCRISTLLNAHDQTYRSTTTINVGTQNNNSPVSTMDPIKTVQQNTFDSFQVPFYDSDADTLTYRLATAADMGDVNFTIPAGVTINPANGTVSFNTNGYPLGAQFALGVIASDKHTSVLVDFIVTVVQQSTPPKFDYAVTPLDAQVIQVGPGQPLNFNVKALDTDIGSSVTLSAVGLPIGSSLSPNLPITGNPVTTSFSWTPTTAQLGTYIVNFTAKDNVNVKTSTSVTIVVSLKPVFDVPPTPAYGIELATTPGTPFQFVVQASDLDHADTVRITNVLNKPATATLAPLPSIGSNPTTANFSWTPAVSDWGEREIQFEATDTYNEKAYHKIGLIVNTPPVFTSTPVTSVVVNHPYSYTITGLDPDLPYGDSLEVISSSTPSWLTFTDNGDGTGTLTGTPGLADIGTHTVTLYLEDIYHHAVANGVPSQVFTITVIPCTIVKDSSFVKKVNCYGLANGSAQVTFNGGFGPFTYAWSNGSSDSILTNVGAGLYSVLITDAYHCSISDSIYITQPADFIADSISVSDYNGYGVSCHGSSNGSATVYAHGGVAPYRTLWSTGDSTASVHGLHAGNFAVFVTDANGCRDSVFVTLNEPTVLSTDSIFVSNYNGYGVSCHGSSNGSAAIHVHGGVPAYRTLWSTGDSTTTVSGLSAGTYAAFVTDRNGCTDSVTVTITQPSVLSADSIFVSNVSCHGSANGSVSLNVHGGVPAYRTTWSTGDSTTTINGLSAGTYVAFVTDANGCTDSVAVTITQPSVLSADSIFVSNYNGYGVSCHGSANGFASLNVHGGVPAYRTIWSTGDSTTTINGLSAGTYFAFVTDANGCTDSVAVTITQPSVLSADSIFVSNYNGYGVSCHGSANGFASLNVHGGVQAYRTIWSTGDSTATVSGLSAGAYVAFVTDANGCTDSVAVTITQPSVLSADSIFASNASCHGTSNGSAAVHVHGGVPAYRTLWSTGDSTTTVSGLSAGTYVVFVKDRNGCADSAAVTITQPTELVATIGGLSNYSGFNVSCFGGNNGFAKATATGGTSPYTYHWSNGNNAAQANNLSAAAYFVVATDKNGCIDSAFVTLTQPAAFTATITSPTVLGAYNTSCSTDGDGTCTVAPVGGIAPFAILWNTSATTATISNLLAGTYSVVLTDKNGCKANKSITLTRPENCNCVTTPPAPTVSCSTCTKVLDGQSNPVINTGDNACIVNAFTGNVSMNGGNLVICGNATLQWLTIPNNSKVTVLGTLTVSGINFNGTNAILENFGTITVNSNLNAAGKITNNKTLVVKQGVNLNAGSSLVNNGVFTIATDLANNGSFVNNGSLSVGNTVYNNSNSSMLNNCTTKARSYFVNSNVVFANNGTLDVTSDIRFNSAVGTVAGGSILRSHDVYLNSTTLTGSASSCALISSAAYTQINQATLSGKISLCDANGYEVKNNLSLQSGANSSCTTCAYTGSASPALRDATADADNSSVQTASGLSVYPNPVSKGMTIKLENAFDIATVSIIDNTGREVLSAATSEINITNLSTGIYIVKVQDVVGNTTLTKLVVE